MLMKKRLLKRVMGAMEEAMIGKYGIMKSDVLE